MKTPGFRLSFFLASCAIDAGGVGCVFEGLGCFGSLGRWQIGMKLDLAYFRRNERHEAIPNLLTCKIYRSNILESEGSMRMINLSEIELTSCVCPNSANEIALRNNLQANILKLRAEAMTMLPGNMTGPSKK
jgi:hypothetical protein